MENHHEETLKNYIKEGKIRAELDELFSNIFMKDVYAGISLKMNQTPMQISIKVLNPAELLENKPLIMVQLQNMIAQRLDLQPEFIRIVFDKIVERSLEPAYHCEMLRQAFVDVKPYKRAINSIIRSVRMAQGQGVCIRVSGKVKGQRAKATKFIDGLLIQAGQPAKEYIKKAKATAKCKQGVIGIQVSIMLPHDPTGEKGPSTILADKIKVLAPKNN